MWPFAKKKLKKTFSLDKAEIERFSTHFCSQKTGLKVTSNRTFGFVW